MAFGVKPHDESLIWPTEILRFVHRTAERVLCSAIRAMLSVPGQKIDDVKSIVNIYVEDGFIIEAKAWSEQAGADRKGEFTRSA